MNTIFNATNDDIAFWTGFYHDEDCFSWASNKAYLDMNRTMTFKDIPKDNSQKEIGRIDAQRKEWRDCGTNAIRESFANTKDDFETWHKELCKKLIAIYGDDKLVLRKGIIRTETPVKLTYGQAQKWLNMTLKYLWLLHRLHLIGDENVCAFIKKHEKSFHIPLDSYILRYAAKQNKSNKKVFAQENNNELNGDFQEYWECFRSAWSQIEDADKYYQYQAALAKAMGDCLPLEWELKHWHKATKYYE